jgi:hypothetical protein
MDREVNTEGTPATLHCRVASLKLDGNKDERTLNGFLSCQVGSFEPANEQT